MLGKYSTIYFTNDKLKLLPHVICNVNEQIKSHDNVNLNNIKSIVITSHDKVQKYNFMSTFIKTHHH